MLRSTLPSRSTNRIDLVLLVSFILSYIVGVGAVNRLQSIATTFNSGIAAQSSSSNTTQGMQGDLPFPSWWSGECDANHYRSTGRASYPLGGAYRGLKACGPTRSFNGGGNYTTRFFGGAWGVLEWECVELVMRYMYLAHGVPPYKANGSQVVWNYKGDKLKQVRNGTPGQAPKPGDVMSYGATTTWGHTSVVVESHVDGNGNGSIKTLNQNMQPFNTEAKQGYRNETVHSWVVNSGATGWLTPKGNQPPNTPSQVAPRNGDVVNTRYVPLQWNDTGDPDNGPRASRDFHVEVRNSTGAMVTTSPWSANTSYTFFAPADGTYFWRVQSGDGGGAENGASTWSGERSFVINTSSCVRKGQGDANCDNRITLEDFEIFRQEFNTPQGGNRRSDFNRDGVVNLRDFEIFRQGLSTSQSGTLTTLGIAADQDAVAGEETLFYFEQTHGNTAPDGSVDIDVYVEGNPDTQISSTDFFVEYPSETLEYDDSASGNLSQECQNTNENQGYLSASPTIFNDSLMGQLHIIRTAISSSSALPYGKVCAGTFRFNAKSEISTPAMASVHLNQAIRATDAAGPQAVLVPQLDDARRTFNVVIGAPAAAPSAPTGLQIDNSTESTISFQWSDASVDEDGFNVYRWNSDSADWDVISWVGPNITNTVNIELNCSTTYDYQVSAFNSSGESPHSEQIQVQTSACAVDDGTPQPTPPLPTATPTTQPTAQPTPISEPQSKYQVFLPMTLH